MGQHNITNKTSTPNTYQNTLQVLNNVNEPSKA